MVENDNINAEPRAKQKVAAIGVNIFDSTPDKANKGRKTTTITNWPKPAADLISFVAKTTAS